MRESIEMVTGQAGPPPKRPPKWRRELRLLRRDGLRKYLRILRLKRRFDTSVAKMDRHVGAPDER